MYKKVATAFPGLIELRPLVLSDKRGSLVKLFHRGAFANMGLAKEFCEVFMTTSIKNVVRGIHFQVPPFDQAKLIISLHGTVFDVIVDLRRGSPTYGRSLAIRLSEEAGNMLYVPAGFGHGFCADQGMATMLYLSSAVHDPAADAGIRWDSVDIEWPTANPILSERDRGFPTLKDFRTPFVFLPLSGVNDASAEGAP